MNKISNTYNPFAHGDPERLAEILASLIPSSHPMSEEERLKHEQDCKAGEAAYKEARYGALPAGTYRILDQGGFAGWHFELEIDGEAVLLRDDGHNEFQVHANRALADKIARAEIAHRHGEKAGAEANFVLVWGGSL